MGQLMRLLLLFLSLTALSLPSIARAQSSLETGFQDMFVTAGYSAAAGAAIGAAALAFQDNPSRNLKFISIGASVGFVGGLLFGGWVALSPALAAGPSRPDPLLPYQLYTNSPTAVVRPWIHSETGSIVGIEAGTVLARF